MKSLKSKIRIKIKQAYSVREISEMLNVPIDYVAMVFLEFQIDKCDNDKNTPEKCESCEYRDHCFKV